MNKEDFVWTDELVKEFASWLVIYSLTHYYYGIFDAVDDFKKEKIRKLSSPNTTTEGDTITSVTENNRTFKLGDHIISDTIRSDGVSVHGIIEKFEYSQEHCIMFVYTSWSGVGFDLSYFSHAEYVLTSVDDVEMYEGDTAYYPQYNTNFELEYHNMVLKKECRDSLDKYFSSPYALQEYIENKTTYTLKQIKEALKNRDFIGSDYLLRKLKNLN